MFLPSSKNVRYSRYMRLQSRPSVSTTYPPHGYQAVSREGWIISDSQAFFSWNIDYVTPGKPWMFTINKYILRIKISKRNITFNFEQTFTDRWRYGIQTGWPWGMSWRHQRLFLCFFCVWSTCRYESVIRRMISVEVFDGYRCTFDILRTYSCTAWIITWDLSVI